MVEMLSLLPAAVLAAAAGGADDRERVVGDFNGDGRAGDRVELVLEGGRRHLLVHFEGETEPVRLADFDPVYDLMVEPAPPGRYENACVRGVFSGCAGRLRHIETATDAFVLRRAESSATLHVWLVEDGGRFLRFALSG